MKPTRTARTTARLDRQRKLVAELRRRLAFEILLLDRMEQQGRGAEPPPRPAHMAEILARARRRAEGRD